MAQTNQSPKEILSYKVIELFKNVIFGTGSYGSVCKAKCDDLLCAAKILHPTLFDPNAELRVERHREHRLPMRRFEQECEFMSAIRHPNIVQYLGTHRDPETHLPVLLMELMDDSLTHFLDSSQKPIPFHIQINICHDIAVALSFLHSNDIIHRDMSSNNVLLIGNSRAKVTDFGMAKLSDMNPQAALSCTMCPGTNAYMPPEATSEGTPRYTEKIDCFSFGVLGIQILTREFPKPGDRMREEIFNGTQMFIRQSEVARRQNHISQVDPNHSLMPIALDCLKDKDVERPSAQELCHRVAALKQISQYTDSERSDTQERNTTEVRELQQQVQSKSQNIERLEYQLETSQRQLQERQQENEQQLQSKSQDIKRLEYQLETSQRQLQENEQQLQNRSQDIEHLEYQLETAQRQLQEQQQENEQQLSQDIERLEYQLEMSQPQLLKQQQKIVFQRKKLREKTPIVLHRLFYCIISLFCCWIWLPFIIVKASLSLLVSCKKSKISH